MIYLILASFRCGHWSLLHFYTFLFKGAVVFSNIVTTVSPTYAQEVRTAEVWLSLLTLWFSYRILKLEWTQIRLLVLGFLSSWVLHWRSTYHIICTSYINLILLTSYVKLYRYLWLQGGRGLHSTLNFHSKKFIGILNGIDADAWNPATDAYLKVQYSANDLEGKAENKEAMRRSLGLSSADARRPLVIIFSEDQMFKLVMHYFFLISFQIWRDFSAI